MFSGMDREQWHVHSFRRSFPTGNRLLVVIGNFNIRRTGGAFWPFEANTPLVVADVPHKLLSSANPVELGLAVFQEAGMANGYAHRFRDTFAVDLLKAGVPMERVSIVLGHSSIKVTEKHYSPWVRARQEQLEADVRRTWERALLEGATGPIM
jgi:hypothetical protein